MWSGAAAAAAAARAVSPPLHAPSLPGRRGAGRPSTVSVRAAGGLMDFVGGDLVKPDLGRWLDDVEEHKALAIYPPHEGGYEGRYLNRLRYQGYYFLDMSARGLGDPESTLTKIHPVCPPSLGRQPVARWYFPPEVDYRLSLLHPDAKGLVVWVLEAKVLSKAELQFLAMLPDLRPKVWVLEMGLQSQLLRGLEAQNGVDVRDDYGRALHYTTAKTLTPKGSSKSTGKKKKLETRSCWHIFRSFNWMGTFYLLALQVIVEGLYQG